MPRNEFPKTEQIDSILLKNGTVTDPLENIEEKMDILIKSGTITETGTIDDDKADKVIDCSGRYIIPGPVDMHVHLREPGEEHKETIASGTMAAMNGGFTGVCCMPNTNPCIDSRNHVEFIKKQAAGGLVDVYPVGAVTKGRKGEELTEMADMKEAGAVGFSDDGSPIMNSLVFRRALEYTTMLNTPLIDHCEDLTIAGDGMMNESIASTYAGLASLPSPAETIQVARDILIAEYCGCRVHIAHVSCAESVRLIRQAKDRNVHVTAETAPHYLLLTDDLVRSYDTNLKMKPPLRTETDRKAMVEAVKDGTIDVIATDHAPHHIDDKDKEFGAAAFGIVGLETAIGLLMSDFVQKKIFPMRTLVEKISVNPRRICGLPEARITADAPASLTVLDPDKTWTIDKSAFYSLSRNTPFHGRKVQGEPVIVVNNGQIFLRNNK